jgi:hypothetical protein
MLFRTRGEHANHYITDAVIMYNWYYTNISLLKISSLEFKN